jgi:2',3'-cyclic-nucleotide 2'-phosphodiesterase
MKTHIRVMLLGDIMGEPGLAMFAKHTPRLTKLHNIDMVIVNGENSSSNGRGISPKIVEFLKDHGAHVVTTGNHIWHNKDIIPYLEDGHEDVLRPANFPSGCPGKGITIFKTSVGVQVAVINIQGRVFMREHLDCPFKAMDTMLSFTKHKTPIVIVDFHAETTSEKLGMGLYLDGKVSCVVGTHTHVQTADARIFPHGTAYITDLGMAGSYNSMIGMRPESVLPNLITQMPSRFAVDKRAPFIMSGIWIEIEVATGKAVHIEQVKVIDDIMSFEQ